MNTELIAAADRLSLWRAGGRTPDTEKYIYGHSTLPEGHSEHWLVTDAYKLAFDFALPLLDGTELTKEMLIKSGAKKQDNHLKVTFYREDNLPLGFWECDDGWKVMLIVDGERFAVEIVRGLKTRGEFVSLARDLHIELKEAT